MRLAGMCRRVAVPGGPTLLQRRTHAAGAMRSESHFKCVHCGMGRVRVRETAVREACECDLHSRRGCGGSRGRCQQSSCRRRRGSEPNGRALLLGNQLHEQPLRVCI